MTQTVPDRLARLAAVLGCLLLLAGPPLAAAAQSATPAAVATPVGGQAATIGEATVSEQFPTGLTFTLKATAPTEIDRVDLLYRTRADPTLTLVQPDFAPGTAVDITHQVDLETDGVPPGIDILWHWRVHQADGTVTESPEQTVGWVDTRFDWVPYAGDGVTVYAYNQDPGFDQTILKQAEDAVATLGTKFGAKPTQPIRIWVYNNKDDFTGALAPNSEPWIGGAALPWYNVIQAIISPGDTREVQRLVPHEVSHLVSFAATKNPFGGTPDWFEEGFATYNQITGKESYPAIVRVAYERGALPSIRSLNGDFPYDPSGATVAYAASLSIVTYVIERWGDDGIAKLIAAFKEGTTPDQAVRQALGLDLDALDHDWRAWVAAQPMPSAGGTSFFAGDNEPPVGGLLAGALALLAVAAGVRALARLRADDPATDGAEARGRLAAGPTGPRSVA